jgi:hypothetical protein
MAKTSATQRLGVDVDRPQKAFVVATEGGANAGIVVPFPSSISTRDPIGIEILRWFLGVSAPADVFTAAADGFFTGLTQLWNNGAPPSLASAGAYGGLVDFHKITRSDAGTAANAYIMDACFFWDLPYPQLVHPAAIFAFIQGISQPGALTVSIGMEYRYVELSDKQFQDILQTIIVANSL